MTSLFTYDANVGGTTLTGAKCVRASLVNIPTYASAPDSKVCTVAATGNLECLPSRTHFNTFLPTITTSQQVCQITSQVARIDLVFRLVDTAGSAPQNGSMVLHYFENEAGVKCISTATAQCSSNCTVTQVGVGTVGVALASSVQLVFNLSGQGNLNVVSAGTTPATTNMTVRGNILRF